MVHGIENLSYVIDSDSEEEVPPSQRYNPSTAPSHGETTPGKNKPEEHSKTASQALDAHPFFNPVAINGMTTYLNSTELKDLGTSENNAIGTPAQQTPLSGMFAHIRILMFTQINCQYLYSICKTFTQF